MKNNYLKLFFTLFLSIYSLFSYSQFNVSINNSTLLVNDNYVNSGGTISFGLDASSMSVKLDVEVTTNNPPHGR